MFISLKFWIIPTIAERTNNITIRLRYFSITCMIDCTVKMWIHILLLYIKVIFLLNFFSYFKSPKILVFILYYVNDVCPSTI